MKKERMCIKLLYEFSVHLLWQEKLPIMAREAQVVLRVINFTVFTCDAF